MDDLEELLRNDDKVYVQVNEDRMPDGTLILNHFYWEDGRKCIINKVTDIRPAHSLKGGGFGIRYEVNFTIEDDEESRIYTKYMWLEENRFFMERK